MLTVAAIILFLCRVTNSSIITIHNMQSRRYCTRWMKDLSIAYSTVPLVIFVLVSLSHSLSLSLSLSLNLMLYWHIYTILYFASRSSSLEKLRKHHGQNHSRKRLANAISCICLSQLVWVTHDLVFQFAAYRILMTNISRMKN